MQITMVLKWGPSFRDLDDKTEILDSRRWEHEGTMRIDSENMDLPVRKLEFKN